MKKQYSEPDRKNVNNYMLDTSAYNHIVASSEKLDAAKKSVSLGFCYYSTAIQDLELSGEGAKTYNKECVPIIKKPMPSEMIQKFRQLDKELDVKLLPEIATCMLNHSRVDGTNRFYDSDSVEGQLFEKIASKNKHESNRPFEYSHDAIIAEAAVHYGCTLVSDDKELRDLMNATPSGRAITTDELLEKINTY
ncbi:hypothetical protein D7V83_19375 [bacterium 0.1xD8-71]|nr:hypothetical protein D7V83_19375 [bacterium 0.1xD8-71]